MKYPTVTLSNLPLEEALVKLLPRQLAYYHLAIPIGLDEGNMTVAMMQPNNIKAREIIQDALRVPIIPVKADAEQIRNCLDRIWHSATSAPWMFVSSQSNSAVVAHYAQQYAAMYDVPLISDRREESLLVQHFSEPFPADFSGSTLLVDHTVDSVSKILHLVRLHTPDYAVVSSLLPLIRSQQSTVTLLPDTSITTSNIAYLIDKTTPHGEHLEKLRSQLHAMDVQGEVHVRQGAFVNIIQAELAHHQYDLVAVAANAYGEIVEMLIQAIREYHLPAVIVIKPGFKSLG